MSQLTESSDDSLGSDGDDVWLREMRKKKKKESKPYKQRLAQLHDRPTSAMHARNEIKIARLKKKLRTAVEKDNVQKVDSLLQKAKQYEPAISKLAIDEENKQNVWHLALSHKSHNVVDYLLNLQDDALLTSDYKIQRSEKEGDRNALHILIEQKDIKRAKQVINTVETPFDMVNTKTPEIIKDQRPRLLACLHLAASYDLKELVEQFLEDDLAGVDDVSDYKDTALMFSARWGNYAIAKTLIENNASIDKENDNGSTALYWAVRYRHVKIVELLLLNGANPNKERKVGLVAPLIAASAYGYNDIVNLLLHEPKCNKQIKDQKGQKAIHHAAREGNEDVLKTLIEKGEQHIDDKDNRKNTPLLLAAQRKRNTNVVFELIIHGADDLHENKERKHSWHYALDSKDSNLLDSLMAACIEKKKDMNKRQPLLIAAKIGRLEMIQYLLAYQQGPLEYPQDPQKNSFLHIAALHDQSDIIDKFHTRKEINSKNDKGDTPLHIACRNGFDKTIKTLLKCKAKTSIKNKEEETPLHVAAKSKKLNAKSVSELVSFTKMHAWACLDALDSTESNCLHLAGKTAEPDAIWAFKYVTLDKYDKDGYTPLHKAVRAGQPEALEKMLNIFEYQHSKAALLDKQSTDKKETVLHLAADEGLSSCVKRLIDLGADLSMKDFEGNTVLHRLTIATDKNQRHTKRHLEVFDSILEMVVEWWCKKEGKEVPKGNSDDYKQFQKKATLHLIYQIPNENNLSVIDLSFKLGAFDIIHRLLMMRNVTMFEEPSGYKFDISSLKPLPKKADNAIVPANDNLSGLEWLIKQKDSKKQAAKFPHILDIPPVKMIEKYYNSIVLRTYLLLMVLHVVNMIIFTYWGVYFSAKLLNESTEINSLDPVTVFWLCVVAIEPFFIVLVLLWRLQPCLKFGIINCTLHLLQTILEVLYSLMYVTLVIIWIVLFVVRCNFQDYILAAALCFGWLYSIMLMRGIKQIHYFFSMLISMILLDFLRFAFVYVFVLFAFSSAFHVLFQISPAVLQIYGNLLDTLFLAFNLMTGRGELFDEDFKTNMNDAGRELTYIKMYYIVYVLLSSIILINLLIAMMNDSYRRIFDKKHVTWRIDSVTLGFDTERMLCNCLRKKISRVSIKREDEGDSDRWFIYIDEKKNKKEFERAKEFMHQRDMETLNIGAKLSSRLEELEDFRGQESILQNPAAMNNANNGHIRGTLESMPFGMRRFPISASEYATSSRRSPSPTTTGDGAQTSGAPVPAIYGITIVFGLVVLVF